MAIQIVHSTQIDREQWAELVEKSTTGTWFQSPQAYDFFASLPELFNAFVIGMIDTREQQLQDMSQQSSSNDKHGVLKAVCVGYVTKEAQAIKHFFTRRAIILGGPCLDNNMKDSEVHTFICALTKEIKQYKPIYIETRNFNDYSPWKTAFETAGWRYCPHLNFHVDCTADIEAALTENRRRQVRKASSAGVIVTPAQSEKEIEEWYSILQKLYLTKVKTPLWPLSFFIQAFRQSIATFLLVKYEGKIIGGSMTTEQKGRCVYEWFECGLNTAYKEQYPSVMATIAGMTMAYNRACQRYDMMGAGEPDKPYGVRDFKRAFGGQQVEHGRFLFVASPLLFSIGKAAVKILKNTGCNG